MELPIDFGQLEETPEFSTPQAVHVPEATVPHYSRAPYHWHCYVCYRDCDTVFVTSRYRFHVHPTCVPQEKKTKKG